MSIFGDIAEQLATPKPALDSISAYFELRIEEGFEREEDPFGRTWQSLDARTFERKTGPLILTESRRLRDFPEPEVVDEFTIVIGPDADIPYARIHAAGGQAGRGAQIPQRQYLGAEEGDVEVSAALLLDHLVSREGSEFTEQPLLL